MVDKPAPVIFRVPPVSVLAVLTLVVCVSPIAMSSWWLSWLFAVPLLVWVWIVRRRTVIDTENVTIRTVLGSRVIGWDEIRLLRVVGRHGVTAVLSGAEVRLPEVRVRHLPLLAERSGGRLPAIPDTTRDNTDAAVGAG